MHVGANFLFDLAQSVSFADIEKMFRHILIHEDDQKWQLILWKFDASEHVQIYKLRTVKYGVGSSPFLANRTMKQLADDEKEKFPLGS